MYAQRHTLQWTASRCTFKWRNGLYLSPYTERVDIRLGVKLRRGLIHVDGPGFRFIALDLEG